VENEIRITDDGSATLFVPELDEHYHSKNGAVQESKHVFIDSGLMKINKKNVRLFEFGFGTGLNVLLTILNGLGKSIVYHAMELYPIHWSVIQKLDYSKFLDLSQEYYTFFERIHKGKWDKEVLIRPDFSFKKINASLLHYTLEGNYDLIYYDAFSPEVQPELWEGSVFEKLYGSLNSDGLLVTYCAKGEVRRRLQAVGYKVERLPGPPGKREMIRAIRP
jgi:tRNA U34 5-methylaminomethyl-2-thiouridine-forming methyltransferase MnmC